MMRPVLIVCATLVFATSVAAFDFVSPTGISAGRTVQISAPGPGDLLNLPVGAAFGTWWRVETGLSRSFDLKDFDRVFVAGAYRRGNITAALGYSQFGHSDLYAEKLVKASASLQRKSWSAGLSGSFMSLGFGGGYKSLNAVAFGLAGRWQRGSWRLAASIDDLNSPSFADSDAARSPRLSLHGEFLSGKSYSLLGRMTLQKNEEAQFGAGQRISLRSSSALLWGFTTAPFAFGGGIELGLRSSRLTYAANYHPVLGLTQMISISYGSAVKQATVDNGLR